MVSRKSHRGEESSELQTPSFFDVVCGPPDIYREIVVFFEHVGVVFLSQNVRLSFVWQSDHLIVWQFPNLVISFFCWLNRSMPCPSAACEFAANPNASFTSLGMTAINSRNLETSHSRNLDPGHGNYVIFIKKCVPLPNHNGINFVVIGVHPF